MGMALYACEYSGRFQRVRPPGGVSGRTRGRGRGVVDRGQLGLEAISGVGGINTGSDDSRTVDYTQSGVFALEMGHMGAGAGLLTGRAGEMRSLGGIPLPVQSEGGRELIPLPLGRDNGSNDEGVGEGEGISVGSRRSVGLVDVVEDSNNSHTTSLLQRNNNNSATTTTTHYLQRLVGSQSYTSLPTPDQIRLARSFDAAESPFHADPHIEDFRNSRSASFAMVNYPSFGLPRTHSWPREEILAENNDVFSTRAVGDEGEERDQANRGEDLRLGFLTDRFGHATTIPELNSDPEREGDRGEIEDSGGGGGEDLNCLHTARSDQSENSNDEYTTHGSPLSNPLLMPPHPRHVQRRIPLPRFASLAANNTDDGQCIVCFNKVCGRVHYLIINCSNIC